jgi:hypothetical protein
VGTNPHKFVWRLPRRHFTGRASQVVCVLALLGVWPVHAQLAITEVMSSASTNLGPFVVVSKSDFWELTNFGTNFVALDGYTYSDLDSNPGARVANPFFGCIIAPGESIIFMRTDTITNRQDFLNWWGANNLPPGLQVRTCPKTPGFDSTVDAVQLWDPNGVLVDRVEFGRAFRGRTFVYDPQSGHFGGFSALGVNGAFKAVQADDIGTPGTTTGPVPLTILQPPADATQDAGLDVEFSVLATGLPRPSYQWFWNGAPIQGATKADLILPSVQPSQAGNYTVRLSNGVAMLFSAPAALLVNTNPSPAAVLVPPSDVTVFEGQTALFSVKARGYPPPTYQWQINGVNISGATNSFVVVSGANLAWSGRIYSVLVQNAHGSTNVSARLEVTRPPRLAITEVMSSVAGGTPSGHTDWFELTNLDTNAVNLTGYRFSDRYSFELSFRITNSLVIQPGESIVFVERLTRDEFIRWWGGDQLPPGIKITTYYGLGLSSGGDIINFWNSAETNVYAPLLSAGFLEAIPGVSQRYLPPDFFFVEDSMAGTAGAFYAAEGNDVGSPGMIINPRPRFISATPADTAVHLKCRVVLGKQYELQSRTQITSASWVTIATYSATNSVIVIPQPAGGEARFFLLKELP